MDQSVVYRACVLVGYPMNGKMPKQSELVERIIDHCGWKPIREDAPRRKQKEKQILMRFIRAKGLIPSRGMGGKTDDPGAWVYIVQQQGGERCVKIGFAKDCEKRIKTLQTASPYPLTIVSRIKADDMQHAKWMESAMHKRFKKYRLNGEWFSSGVIHAFNALK